MNILILYPIVSIGHPKPAHQTPRTTSRSCLGSVDRDPDLGRSVSTAVSTGRTALQIRYNSNRDEFHKASSCTDKRSSIRYRTSYHVHDGLLLPAPLDVSAGTEHRREIVLHVALEPQVHLEQDEVSGVVQPVPAFTSQAIQARGAEVL